MVELAAGIGIFVLIWVLIVRELYKAPLIEEDENIVDLDKDDEFLC